MKKQTNALRALSTFDVLEQIVKFLESGDIETLLMTCTTMLTVLHHNDHYVYNWLNRALIRELKLPISSFFHQSERRVVYTGLRQIKNHFCSHPDTPIADYLCYMVERKNQCETLFHRLVETVYTDRLHPVNTKAQRTNKTLRFLITYSDLVYILVHGNLRVAKLTLQNVSVGPDTTTQAINQLIYPGLNHAYLSKVELLVDEFLAKACFPNLSRQQQLFFNQILFEIIKGFHNTTLQRILQRLVKYRGYQIQYQLLSNTCLAHDNVKGLIICVEHMHMYARSTKITVDPRVVGEMVERGHSNSLKYVIEHLLGDTINMKTYINKICSGIARSTKADPYLLQSVAQYFTDANLELINKYLMVQRSS